MATEGKPLSEDRLDIRGGSDPARPGVPPLRQDNSSPPRPPVPAPPVTRRNPPASLPPAGITPPPFANKPIAPAGPPVTVPQPPQTPQQTPQQTPLPPAKPSAGAVPEPLAVVGKKRRGKSSRRKAARDVPTDAQQHLVEQHSQRRRAPSWLTSLVTHLLLLLILALIPISDLASGPLTFFLGESSGDVASEFALADDDSDASELMQSTDTSPIQTIDATEPLKQLELPKLPDPVTVIEPSTMAVTEVLESLPFGISEGLSGRSGTTKQALLQRFGGNGETEAAVDMGLAWLSRQQNSDGSWSLLGPYSGGGALENRTAATAMAVNAFLGAGHTPTSGKYANNVKLGLAYIVRLQDNNGLFAGKEPQRQIMYAQAIASICVIEAYGMTKDTKLLTHAQKAIDYAEWSQSKLRGWRYDPREDADTSVTGWFVMALETGKMAGLKVDQQLLGSVSSFLDSVSHEDYTRYSYTDFRGPSLSMTAEALLCRIYLGWPRTHPALMRAIRDDLLTNLPSDDGFESSVYYLYYATQVLHHVGGEPWKQWNAAMKRVLPATQVKNGPERGSWSAEHDLYGAAGGRLYTTCLSLYCLEVYYRHLAIYDLDQ